jgi:hypothetical protein
MTLAVKEDQEQTLPVLLILFAKDFVRVPGEDTLFVFLTTEPEHRLDSIFDEDTY